MLQNCNLLYHLTLSKNSDGFLWIIGFAVLLWVLALTAPKQNPVCLGVYVSQNYLAVKLYHIEPLQMSKCNTDL